MPHSVMGKCGVLPILLAWTFAAVSARAPNPSAVTYEGTTGPGAGKHIVWIAGDHEYRGEETLPALARILSRRYGFKSTVLFTTDPKSGDILPGSSHLIGLDVLKDADLLVVFLRFQDFPDEEMQHIVDYLARGGPVVGLRTSTHAFQIKRPDARFLKFTWNYKGPEYQGGFGRQILGETWVSHYGRNHAQSSRLLLQRDRADDPILRGIGDVWVQSGGYTADPMPDSTILALGQILDGMNPNAPAAPGKELMPVAWTRTYTGRTGGSGRVFTTTHGASVDLLDDGFRRLLVNGTLWAAGLEAAVRPDLDIRFVGPFQPSRFAFNGYVTGIKPAALAGWDSPIPGQIK